MESRIVRAGLGLGFALVLVVNVAHAQTPLSRDALSKCASQVQALREESARLAQKNAEIDLRRNAINERTSALKTERDNLKPDDLQGGLALRQSLQRHSADTLAFNGDVEKLKDDIRAVNVVKKDYDGTCANRSYKSSDLAALPESAQNAMRSGLGGVQVPFIGP